MRCGYKAPPNSSFKGIMSSDSIVEYLGYTGRDEAKDSERELEINEAGYFAYNASHHEGDTRSNIGVLDSEEKRNEFIELISKNFRNKGDLAWENVLSIQDFQEAEKFGLYKVEDWEAALNKALPKFFRYAGFDPDNIIYWWDYHVNKSHPHVHIVWMEKEKTVTDGYLPPRYLKALKRYTALELEARQRLCEKIDTTYQEFFKNKDLQFKELLVNVDQYLKDNKRIDIDHLYKILPRTGRLQYNSYAMKDYKPLIDRIIDNIIQQDKNVNDSYNTWMKNIDLLADNMNEIQGSNIESFKKAELDKLYTRIGNKILQQYKAKPVCDIDKNNKQRYRASSRVSKNFTKKILGAYCMEVINEQNAEMEESLREFLRINGLEMN